MTTVLWRRSALGDVVLAGSVAKALGDVVFVTAPEWVPVARRMTGVARAVPWPKDAVPEPGIADAVHVDLQGSLRSWRAVPADRRIAKRSVQRRLRLLGFPIGRPSVPALYGEAAGVAPAGPPWIEVTGTEAAPRDALAIVPGASVPTKQWARWDAVARAWDGPVIVLGGPGDEAACEAVVAGSGRGDLDVVCERGFDGTFARLGRVRVVAGGDTGLLHLCGAAGAAVVGVFGPTHPDDGFFPWAAWGRGEVVQRALWCRPCSLHGRSACPLGHHRCMDLDAQDVLGAIGRWWSAWAVSA